MSRWLALLALAGCSVARAELDPNATPYSCESIVAASQPRTVDPQLVAPWRALADAGDRDRAWLGRVRAQAARPLPAALSTEERVRLQHELVQIAQRIDVARRDPSQRIARGAHVEVMALIRATAPSAAELAALGDGGRPAVAAILGGSITERATSSCGSGHSVHVAVNRGTLAFRPLRAGDTRALVAQLVAFDSAGVPHITPLVEGIELRLGNEVRSPACVVQVTDDGRLQPAEHATLEEHRPFVTRNGYGLGCNGCHRDPSAMSPRDLDAAQVREIDVLRNRQVDELATQLWARLNERL